MIIIFNTSIDFVFQLSKCVLWSLTFRFVLFLSISFSRLVALRNQLEKTIINDVIYYLQSPILGYVFSELPL